MRSVKEKVSNAASAAQEHVDIYKAHVQEKVIYITISSTQYLLNTVIDMYMYMNIKLLLTEFYIFIACRQRKQQQEQKRKKR